MKPVVQSQRFHILDVMRTLAAIVVAERHTNLLFGGPTLAGGYLAVDFFFVLSGFVIASAYEERLDKGMTAFRFMQIRAIRLYPLYIAALCIGALAFVLSSKTAGTFNSNAFLITILAGLFFIPLPFRITEADPQMFPFNSPSWTLLFELFANVCHAMVLKSMRIRHLLVVIGVSFLLLVAAVLYFGSLDLGYKRTTFVTGFPRVLFSYTVGIVIYRTGLWRRMPLNLPVILAPLLLVLVLAIPADGAARIAVDLICVLVVFPCLVVFSTNLVGGHNWNAALLRFGSASYAIYVLHLPLFKLYSAFPSLAGAETIRATVPYIGLVFLAALIAIAIALDVYFDAPVRKALSRLLRRKPFSPAPVSP